MKRKAELLALAERVEALTGPDRDVDLAIERQVGTSAIHDDHLDRHPEAARNFTASIDAAMALVPEGWGYTLVAVPAHKFESVVREWRPKDGKYWTSKEMAHSGEVIGATMALAICAAALRALQKGPSNG